MDLRKISPTAYRSFVVSSAIVLDISNAFDKRSCSGAKQNLARVLSGMGVYVLQTPLDVMCSGWACEVVLA